MYALALGTSAFAQRAPVPGGGAALGPAAAPLGVRQNKRKYISLFGNVEIADETTFIYECGYSCCNIDALCSCLSVSLTVVDYTSMADSAGLRLHASQTAPASPSL